MLVEVNTNNGVERKNRDFKYQYLQKQRGRSLSYMMETLVEKFVREKYYQ